MAAIEGIESGVRINAELEPTAFHAELIALQDAGRARLRPIQQLEAPQSNGAPPPGDAQSAPESKAEQILSDTLKKYVAEARAGKDPADLVKELGPKFKESIKVADETYSTTLTDVQEQLKKLQPEIDAAKQQVKSAADKLGTTLQAVPANKQAEVAAAAKEYLQFDEMVAEKAHIADSLKQQPGLLPAADTLHHAIAAKTALDKQANASPEDIAKAEKSIKDAVDSVNKIIVTMPAASRQQVAQLVLGYAALDTSDAHKTELLSALKQYPGLLESIDNLKQVEQALKPLAAKIEPLQERMLNALIDSMETRKVYGEALSAAGEDEQAKTYLTQAQLLALKIASGKILPQDPEQEQIPPPGKDPNIRLI